MPSHRTAARPARNSSLYRIRSTRQIEALTSPARQEVVDGLEVAGPCSIAELAELLGRAPDSLYYHVRKLEGVGLIVRAGTRGEGARAEALYDTPGYMVLDHEPATARERSTLMRLVGSVLRIAERDLRAALESGLAIYRRCARRNAWGARAKGWLTREELAEVREHLEAISLIFGRGKKRRGSSLHAVAFVLTPLTPSDRAGAVRKSRSRKEED